MENICLPSQVPPDTDSCLNCQGGIVSNEPAEISSCRETVSSPSSHSDPRLSLWALKNEFFIYYSEVGMSQVCRHRGAREKCAACKHTFAALKLNKSAILFHACLHTVLTGSACLLRSTNFPAALFRVPVIAWNGVWTWAGCMLSCQNMLLFNGQRFDLAAV